MSYGTSGTGVAGPYHMTKPDLAEARASIDRLYGGNATGVWEKVLQMAGLTGRETDDASFAKLMEGMRQNDPVTGLCARALEIRMAAFVHLSEAHALIRSVE